MLLEHPTVYLKTKGINPETHPVVTELQRIKSYYGKLQNAEHPEKRLSYPSFPYTTSIASRHAHLLTSSATDFLVVCSGKFAVDKPAAARFIKNALVQQQAGPTPPTEIGMNTRFNILRHQEAALASTEDDDASSSDEEPTKLVEAHVARHLASAKGKGKETVSSRASTPVVEATSGVQVVDAGILEKEAGGSPAAGRTGKSKRLRIDPFSGEYIPSIGPSVRPAGVVFIEQQVALGAMSCQIAGLDTHKCFGLTLCRL